MASVIARGVATCSSPSIARAHRQLPARPVGPRVAWRSSAAPQSSRASGLIVRRRRCQQVRSAQEEQLAGTEETEGSITELTKDDFFSYLGATDQLVVVDFYTDWCGPCKMIYPQLVELNASLPDVELVKFNCNKYNKELGKELGIKVAPTFHLYKGGSKVAEMSGAKMDKLKGLIEANK